MWEDDGATSWWSRKEGREVKGNENGAGLFLYKKWLQRMNQLLSNFWRGMKLFVLSVKRPSVSSVNILKRRWWRHERNCWFPVPIEPWYSRKSRTEIDNLLKDIFLQKTQLLQHVSSRCSSLKHIVWTPLISWNCKMRKKEELPFLDLVPSVKPIIAISSFTLFQREMHACLLHVCYNYFFWSSLRQLFRVTVWSQEGRQPNNKCTKCFTAFDDPRG